VLDDDVATVGIPVVVIATKFDGSGVLVVVLVTHES